MKTNNLINSDNILSTRNLDIIFNYKKQNEFILLKNVNYKFEKGKVYFIIGNSGTGKTTLVTHFNGLLKSKFGDIFVKQYPILGKQRKVKKFKKIRRNISLVFQFPEYQLFKDTIEKDIMFGPINLGVEKQEAKKRAKIYLNKMGLEDKYLYRSPFALSGGQKRRVALAGVLAIESDIVVFDEPTVGLDPVGEKSTYEIINDLKNQGKTVIVITHNMDHVLEYGDEVILLHDKKIFKSGSPYELFLDNDVISKTNIVLPKVITFANKLCILNPKFKSIFDKKPKNVSELSKTIFEIIGQGKEQ